ncbi:MAG: RraA family protein [Aquincola tertiaricarbonis]
MNTKTDSTAAWPPGYAVHPRTAGPDAAIVAAFRSVPAAHASDCLGRSVGAIGLVAYHADLKLVLCGPAITVRVRPGDNLMLHKAMLMAEPGDVIVVDGGGDCTQALIGGLMRTTALARGIAGFVIDGAIRDIVEWAGGGLPIYARGHTHRGPSKEGPGEVNVPIACAGLSVMPGDLVLGDADGVLAIPAAEAAALLPKVQAKARQEERVREANRSGTPDPERFDALLRARGCPV